MDSKTAAYNANEVAAVYMSLNLRDLLSQAEGGNKLGNDDTLKNGFYGLSDPMNLRGVLESFECNFSEGGNKANYKIRILNPTPQLESTIFDFYSQVFPSNMSTIEEFKTASQREERLNHVEGIVGRDDESLTANTSVPMLPSFYLRWGYGTDANTGLSRIHQARVQDVKYLVNDKEDKVIELYANDMLYGLTSNPVFNKRPYVVRTEVSDEADGQFSLRKPSEILTELLTEYLTTYPQCVPAVDLASYTEPFDNVVFSLAKAMAKGDAISARNKRLEEAGLTPTQSTTTEAKELTEKEVAAFYDLLDRPIITAKDIDRAVTGDVTPQILYQAFKMVFEQIGLKWEMRSPHEPEPVTGSIAPQQTTGLNTDPVTDAEDQVAATNNIHNVKINILRDWLEPGLQSSQTLLPEWDNQHRLSFWPMALSAGYLRRLTVEEKVAHPEWQIWLNAGMINTKNYFAYRNKGEDQDLKFSFDFATLALKFNEGEEGFGNEALSTVDVCMPFPLDSVRYIRQNGLEYMPLAGIQNFVNDNLPLVLKAPVIDLTTNDFLPFNSGNVGTPGDIKNWMAAAVYVNDIQDRFDDAELNVHVRNPPLIQLEPTQKTVEFVLLNVQKYHNFEAEQEKLKQGGAALSNVVKELKATVKEHLLPTPQSVKFKRFIDRYSNAYVSMGDDGENPHTTSFLQSTLNNINRLIVGKSSKLRIESVQINALSTEEKAMLVDSCTLLEGVTWEEVWAKNNHSLLFCMPGDDLTTQFADVVLKPINSFPQTYSVDTGNNYIWLDYGTPNSLIANVDFTGDVRPIINLAQSMFSVRQWNDVTQVFDGTLTISTNMVTNAISRLLANEIALLKTQNTEEPTETQLRKREFLESQLTLARNQTTNEIDMQLLMSLPGLITSYQMYSKKGVGDMSETEVISPNDLAQLKRLSSLISDPTTLEMLFPTANVEGATNTIQTEVLMVTGGTKKRNVIKQNRILRRKVDLDNIYSRISQEALSKKMTDVSYNYSVAMQQESFNLKVTTLGIPEIDDPTSEYLARRVCFKFFDPRLNGTLHWMSGVYQLTGFRHLINPSQGFLTELDLIKLPNESLPNIRDTR